ncbi:4154_t:CDS:2 [Cetraspora pellucida]|uniref:4154_t:CDS:1 n=1 Tax=Cetraspora pellucida TaxID=1433469 RepID=A0ACA9KKC3_9GLOM|nr:4154_t:CDS:2 [Cetraspora pellucida]
MAFQPLVKYVEEVVEQEVVVTFEDKRFLLDQITANYREYQNRIDTLEQENENRIHSLEQTNENRIHSLKQGYVYFTQNVHFSNVQLLEKQIETDIKIELHNEHIDRIVDYLRSTKIEKL